MILISVTDSSYNKNLPPIPESDRYKLSGEDLILKARVCINWPEVPPGVEVSFLLPFYEVHSMPARKN